MKMQSEYLFVSMGSIIPATSNNITVAVEYSRKFSLNRVFSLLPDGTKLNSIDNDVVNATSFELSFSLETSSLSPLSSPGFLGKPAAVAISPSTFLPRNSVKSIKVDGTCCFGMCLPLQDSISLPLLSAVPIPLALAALAEEEEEELEEEIIDSATPAVATTLTASVVSSVATSMATTMATSTVTAGAATTTTAATAATGSACLGQQVLHILTSLQRSLGATFNIRL